MVGTWILGKGEFVKQFIQQSDKRRKVQFSALERLQQTVVLVEEVCKKENVGFR
ncbi:hypothetical protein ES703_78167 [subsurface metagenome]